MEEHFFSSDCFNIKNTLENGQCFRWNQVDKDTYQGVAAGRALRLKQYGDGVLFSCSDEDFSYWRRYFDLDTDYAAIEGRFIHDSIIGDCVKAGTGMHILRQELWEVLISFIISQNNNIKRIKGIISRLCESFGENKNGWYDFPSAEKIAALTLDDLSVLRSGFRAKYILDAAQKVSGGEIDLEGLKKLSTDEAREQLIKIKGVGPKVADCAILFSLCHIDAFPKDVWIKRAMTALFGGELPENAKPYAGIAQQYIFFYARETKLEV